MRCTAAIYLQLNASFRRHYPVQVIRVDRATPGFLSIRSPSNLVIYSIYKSFILSTSNFTATSLLNHRYISGANSLKNTCIRRFPLPIPAP